MPRFEPFRGIHYDFDRIDPADVTAPPYDVIDPDLRATLAARHPANVVHVDLPAHPDGEGDAYRHAAATFRRWLDDGTLLQDPEPGFYVYRVDYLDDHGRARHTTGVYGALELSPPGETPPGGGQPILPHELTTPKAKSDRLALQRATRANLSAVWGLSPTAGLTDLLDTTSDPLARWTDADGVTHSLWRTTDEQRLQAIGAAVSGAPVVIADGHHRYETALRYLAEQGEGAAHGELTSSPAAVMTWVVELADDELCVQPIHRLLCGLPAGFDVAGALSWAFEIGEPVEVGPGVVERMQQEGFLVLVEPGGAVALRPRTEVLASTRDLDSCRLEASLRPLPPHDVVYQHGIRQVVDRVRKGEASAGVLLRPATVRQIVEIAHGGERMPPKTTFFHPKPATGVVFRSLG
ncbi:DUF1015 family protein [Rhabdothermincola sediminis]|uniref:DUF1015 family protein n=1 Tax=Rhabdothermincola sediminis TaxID=2751370 RepID=UPI001AA0AE75|nr:DUF1015 domain-containing protein [Rhabdothermincola sediminis]